MSEKQNYRVTTRRPVGGRMRAVGEIVELSRLEAATELGWGGLEPVSAAQAGLPDDAPAGPRAKGA